MEGRKGETIHNSRIPKEKKERAELGTPLIREIPSKRQNNRERGGNEHKGLFKKRGKKKAHLTPLPRKGGENRWFVQSGGRKKNSTNQTHNLQVKLKCLSDTRQLGFR